MTAELKQNNEPRVVGRITGKGGVYDMHLNPTAEELLEMQQYLDGRLAQREGTWSYWFMYLWYDLLDRWDEYRARRNNHIPRR